MTVVDKGAAKTPGTNVTIFKSLGLAVEDLAAAIAIYETAVTHPGRKAGLTRIDLNGLCNPGEGH